ncbi:methyltransferase [Methanofollis formosanus]|nr:methyltransferase dimerization domain-containing protein [Methanofollis formosanus]
MKERLATFKPPIEDHSHFLREICGGFETSQIFMTSHEMGVFNHLAEKKTADAVANELSITPRATAKLLDILAAMEVLDKTGNEYVVKPTLKPFLVEGEPYYARYLNFNRESRKIWMDLPDLLKNGSAEKTGTHKHDYGREDIEWIARGCMLGRLQSTLKIVCGLPEFRSARRLIDFGGGHGLFGIAMAQENPDLEVFIFDQPGITEVTEDFIKKYDLEDRVSTITGDYLVDDPGDDYDIAFEACSFGGTPDEALKFYSNVSDCLKKGGLFVSQTFTIDDDRTQPLSSLIWDLKESLTGEGHMNMKTNSELFSLFEKAGLQGENVFTMSEMSMPMRIVTARKPEDV